MILLLFWVVGGWVGEINTKDQLSPIEIETGTEFGKNYNEYKVCTTLYQFNFRDVYESHNEPSHVQKPIKIELYKEDLLPFGRHLTEEDLAKVDRRNITSKSDVIKSIHSKKIIDLLTK